MDSDLWLVVLQTAIILMAIIASFFGLRERISVLENRTTRSEADIQDLGLQVQGVSRHVAQMEGAKQAVEQIE